MQVNILTCKLKMMKKILCLKLTIIWQYQNIKYILQKIMLENDLNNFLRLIELETLHHGHMYNKALIVKKLLKGLMKANYE